MKSLFKTGFVLMALFLGTNSCSNDDDSPPPAVRIFDANGAWDCELNESCQDVYEFDLPAGARISIVVEQVTGSSVVRLAIHGPGNGLGGINMLTGNQNDLRCGGQDVDLAVANFETTSSGTHIIAVTRDWALSAGFDGTYSLSMFSDMAIDYIDQTVDDVDSLAPGSECN